MPVIILDADLVLGSLIYSIFPVTTVLIFLPGFSTAMIKHPLTGGLGSWDCADIHRHANAQRVLSCYFLLPLMSINVFCRAGT